MRYFISSMTGYWLSLSYGYMESFESLKLHIKMSIFFCVPLAVVLSIINVLFFKEKYNGFEDDGL